MSVKQPQEPTKFQLQQELTALRSQCEFMKRQTKQLAHRTSRLYRAIEDLSPEGAKDQQQEITDMSG